jgi:hypothetical protein
VTFFIEFCGPWQWKPGVFRSTRMLRIWWGIVAIGFMRGDMKDFHDRAASGTSEWTEPPAPEPRARGF